MRLMFVIFVYFIISPLILNAAEISIEETSGSDPTIFVKGVIKKGDKDKLEKLSRQVVKGGNEVIISLNSCGGDMQEALEIGAFIKKLNARTEVEGIISKNPNEEKTKCLSACFIIFASGSIRDHRGDNILFDKSGQEIIKETPVIGIHRPYFEKKIYSDLSPEEARKKYEKLEKDLREYLKSISIPGEIIDKMFSNSSDEVAYLTKSEYKEKIGYRQPFFEEWLISKCGSLSKSEINDLGAVSGDRIFLNNKDHIPKDISPGYVKYLKEKSKKINKCKEEAVFMHQKEVLGL